MKKLLLSFSFLFYILSGQAQLVQDSVFTGATYANQVWYNLSTGQKTVSAKANWDIAFDISGFGSTILINSVTGTTLWPYKKGDSSAWKSFDTSGLATWPKYYNSDTSWSLGAFSRQSDPKNDFDLGWGTYNMTTHFITGDSLYLLKLANGKYKKIFIQSLAGGAYNFKYADLDGSNEKTGVLTKSKFSGKNFGYYSLQNDSALNREPLSAEWDLVFGQYTTFIPSAYNVTGVLANAGVKLAKAKGEVNSYKDYAAQTYTSPINGIGYDWKTFNGSAYVMKDSAVYFCKRRKGDIWKIIFTGFSGGGTGKITLGKEQLTQQTAVLDAEGTATASMAVYPNPSHGMDPTIIYSLENRSANVRLNVLDLSGRLVYTTSLENMPGLHQFTLPSTEITAGLYIVSLNIDGQSMNTKLIIGQ